MIPGKGVQISAVLIKGVDQAVIRTSDLEVLQPWELFKNVPKKCPLSVYIRMHLQAQSDHFRTQEEGHKRKDFP
jgi:hypothetical protein